MAGERDSYQLEKRYFRKDGEMIWAKVTAVLVRRPRTGQPKSAISMIEDITERKAGRGGVPAARPRSTSTRRSTTRSPGSRTGRCFRDRIQQAILTAGREGGRVAVLMMDLDRFKEVNDSLGHHAGDALLEELARRLQNVLRTSDTVARLGGDEFGLLLPKHDTPADVIQALEKIRQALEQPIVLQDLPLAIEASIGVSLFPEDGEDVDTLLQHADVAMYAAKEANSAYAFYDEASDTYDPARLTLVGELRRAIDERELVLYYQPKATLASGEVTSVEALLRWNHPARGLVLPDDFIPLAQQTGPDQAAHALRRRRGAQAVPRLAGGRAHALDRRQPLDAQPARPRVPGAGRTACSKTGASTRRCSSSRSPSRRCSPTRRAPS